MYLSELLQSKMTLDEIQLFPFHSASLRVELVQISSLQYSVYMRQRIQMYTYFVVFHFLYTLLSLSSRYVCYTVLFVKFVDTQGNNDFVLIRLTLDPPKKEDQIKAYKNTYNSGQKDIVMCGLRGIYGVICINLIFSAWLFHSRLLL